MLKKTFLAGAVLALLFANNAFAIDSTTGTTAGSFLKIDIGARPASLGGAFVAAADDINAVYWNPAGLATLNKIEIGAMHQMWFSDIAYDFVGFSYPLDLGVLAFNVSLLSLGTFEGYTVDSAGDPVEAASYSASDLAIGASYGLKFLDDFFIGATIKYISEGISDMSASTFAVDFGILWQNFIEQGFSIGCNFQNFGLSMKYRDVTANLATNIKAGICYKDPSSMNIYIDGNFPSDNKIKVNGGVELPFINEEDFGMDIRLGYGWRFNENSVYEYNSLIGGISAGAGFKIAQAVYLDYAGVTYANLGLTHRVSLVVKLIK